MKNQVLYGITFEFENLRQAQTGYGRNVLSHLLRERFPCIVPNFRKKQMTDKETIKSFIFHYPTIKTIRLFINWDSNLRSEKVELDICRNLLISKIF